MTNTQSTVLNNKILTTSLGFKFHIDVNYKVSPDIQQRLVALSKDDAH